MGFDLEADGEAGVDFDEAGVVGEGGEDKAGLGGHDVLADFADEGFEEAVHDFGLAVAGVGDLGGKNAVFAVFAPGLGDDFEFDVGGFAAGFLVVGADRFHVVGGER